MNKSLISVSIFLIILAYLPFLHYNTILNYIKVFSNITKRLLQFLILFYTIQMKQNFFFPSLSVQKLKYKCKVPLIQNFTLLFYLFFLLCTNLYHNNLILLILLFLFSILFLVIYLTLSFLHFLVIYNIHLLSWLLLRYS